MRLQDILTEYMILGQWKPRDYGKRLTDRMLCLGPPRLLREYAETVTLHFLDSSSRLQIPRDYFEFTRSLNVNYGEQLLYLEASENDSLDLFILGLVRASRLLYTTSDMTSSGEILGILTDLASLGTAEFREFTGRTGIILEPWIYESNRKTLEL